jgi:hypothetical protein
MYLQITTRCNMTCAHCCMNCTNEGEDMSIETVKAALKEFEGEAITIGGGEPTIHPQFWEIFGLVMGASLITDSEMVPCIITNGSMTDISLALAALARKGSISAALSQDNYHDMIDGNVIEAFTVKNRTVHAIYGEASNDCREIRNVMENEINAGRCDFGVRDECPCNDYIVQPDGSVKVCGCDESPIVGNVNCGFDQSDIRFPEDHCCKQMEMEEVYA